MPSRWYRSLYWRIAIGFMLCLAVMLVVQAVLFIWIASRAGPTMPGQPPARFAETVALDIAAAIEREPTLDVEKFVHEQYGRDSHPVLVMMTGGRVIENGGGPFPEQLVRQARVMLERRSSSDADRFDRGGRFGGGDRGGLGPGPGFRPMRPAPIMVKDQVAGVVVVPLRAPFWFLFSRYAPTLTLVTSGVLVVGALASAVIIFGPARRRLRAVEQAARQLGGGDLAARAPSNGGADGRRPGCESRCAGRVGSRAPPAARRRLPRADDAGDGDARLSRNAADAGVRPRRGHAIALSRDRRR
jgi:hypothetical protein